MNNESNTIKTNSTLPVKVREAMEWASKITKYFDITHLSEKPTKDEAVILILADHIRAQDREIERMKQGNVLMERVGDCFDEAKNKIIADINADRDQLKAENAKFQELVNVWKTLTLDAHGLFCIPLDFIDTGWIADKEKFMDKVKGLIEEQPVNTPVINFSSTSIPCPECGSPSPIRHAPGCRIGEAYQ
jgi:hypothetical protein